MNSRMKKILILTHEYPPFRGGIGTYVQEIATAADKSGYNVTVIAPDYAKFLRNEDKKIYKFKVIRFRGNLFSAKYFIPTLFRSFYYAYFKKYDIIHVVDWPHLIALSFINKFIKISFIATIHGSEIYSLNSTKYVKLLKIKNIFDFPIKILAISEFSKKLLLEKFPNIDSGKIIVTLLGVSQYWFKHVSNNDIRSKLKIPLNHKLLLTVSRLDERKGHYDVINAIKLLHKKTRNNLSYIIVGVGENTLYKNKLQKATNDTDCNIVFTGQISDYDLRLLYNTASLFCLPGKYFKDKVEGFGLVFIEAAAQGLPSIGGTFGGMSEAIKHNKTGILVPPNVVALSKAIDKLISNSILCNDMGFEAKNWAKTFTWEECAIKSYGKY